jgi:SAM-dependent methyltransferase
MSAAASHPREGRLGDTPLRDYAHKLSLFNALAAAELRRLIRGLGLIPGMRILDAGCGTGEALNWLLEEVLPDGQVTGIDLSEAHAAAARGRAAASIMVHSGDLSAAPFVAGSFDLVWCVNTIHHLVDPLEGTRKILSWLRPGGRLAFGQSSFLPDMYFSWDSRLEQRINDAVRRYYRDRYRLDESDLRAVRGLVGLLRQAGAHGVTARTVAIERLSPLDAAALAYLTETVLSGAWGERLRDYLAPEDHAEFMRLGDPQGADYAPRRPDFHFLQTFTLVTGEI